MMRTTRPVRSVLAALGAIAVAVAVTVVATSGGDHRPSVVAPAQPVPATSTAPVCTAPASGSPGPVPSQPVAPSANVDVPGATPIDTKGLVPGAVTETADGAAWTILRDPRAAQPVGMVARIDVGARTVTGISTVVSGCVATAVAGHGTTLWVATCNAAATGATTSGAELVRLDGFGQIGTRIPLPTSCVDQLAVGDTTLWAASASRSATPSRLFRVNPATGHVDELATRPGEQVTGLATVGDDLWSARAAPSGARLVRTDGRTAADTLSVPMSAARLLGVAGTNLWTEDNQHATLDAHDPATGAARASVPIPSLQAAAVAASGPWYEQASTASLRITLGHVGVSSTPGPVVAFTGAGPDRTGLPFLGTLGATTHGGWLASQDHLFLVPAPPG